MKTQSNPKEKSSSGNNIHTENKKMTKKEWLILILSLTFGILAIARLIGFDAIKNFFSF